jgi:hypothetical protein
MEHKLGREGAKAERAKQTEQLHHDIAHKPIRKFWTDEDEERLRILSKRGEQSRKINKEYILDKNHSPVQLADNVHTFGSGMKEESKKEGTSEMEPLIAIADLPKSYPERSASNYKDGTFFAEGMKEINKLTPEAQKFMYKVAAVDDDAPDAVSSVVDLIYEFLSCKKHALDEAKKQDEFANTKMEQQERKDNLTREEHQRKVQDGSNKFLDLHCEILAGEKGIEEQSTSTVGEDLGSDLGSGLGIHWGETTPTPKGSRLDGKTAPSTKYVRPPWATTQPPRRSMFRDWAAQSPAKAQSAMTDRNNLAQSATVSRYNAMGCQTDGNNVKHSSTQTDAQSATATRNNVKHSSTQTDSQSATATRYNDFGCQTELDTQSAAATLYNLPQSTATARNNNTEIEDLISKMKARVRSLPPRPKTKPIEKVEKMTVPRLKVNENMSVEMEHKVKGEKEEDWDDVEVGGEGDGEDWELVEADDE